MARIVIGPAGAATSCWSIQLPTHHFDTASYRENAEGYLLTKDAMVWFWNHYLRSAADGNNPLASPLRAANLRGLPPAMVLTALFIHCATRRKHTQHGYRKPVCPLRSDATRG